VTGIGPRRGSGPDREPRRRAGTDPDAQAAAARLFHQAYLDGQQSVTRGGYQAGHSLGHDVGYGADNGQHHRSFVAGVLEGHAAGLEARRELIEAAGRGEAASTVRDAHARIDARQQETAADTQPEPEAEAG
jgi:hypothetical protein